jgi:GntR family transcriptional regulator, transcriptional repressor for pyruvate dehydrogenase complex
MTYKPLKSQRLYEQLTDNIKTQIINGELISGDKLPNERELSEKFGVSRTVVREAMKALAQEGLIEVRPGRGTFVVYQTLDVVKRSLGNLGMFDKEEHWSDLVELRELFEPGIAFLAAQRAIPEHILSIAEAVTTMENALDNADVYIAADNKFHNSLALATGNNLIVSLLDPIIELLLEQRRYVFNAKHGGPRAGQIYHKRILKAIKEKNAEAARQAMIDHLRQVRQDTDENNRQKSGTRT